MKPRPWREQWLAKEGKRWRPFLAVCVWKAFQEDPLARLPNDLRRIAIAVECFHKASLIHDDIEDGDDLRYGEATLHASHGVPIALNVGDLLLGEGYRLIGECEAPGKRVAAMLRVAAAGHRTLCLGQGDELGWAQRPRPLRSTEVLDIFRRKTSPAFEVALQLGAIFGGDEDAAVAPILTRYSNALGIAYQIRDNIQDITEGENPSDLQVMRPTLPLAILNERVSDPAERGARRRAWRRECSPAELEQVRRLLETYEVAHALPGASRVVQGRGATGTRRASNFQSQRSAAAGGQQDFQRGTRELVQ